MDIGPLDAAISVGFPGTVASLRQQGGRAGRRGHGLAVLVASEDALDQYFMREPETLLGRKVEAAILDHANQRVLERHLGLPPGSPAGRRRLPGARAGGPGAPPSAGARRGRAGSSGAAATIRPSRRRSGARHPRHRGTCSPSSTRRRAPGTVDERARTRPSTRGRSTFTWASSSGHRARPRRRMALVEPFAATATRRRRRKR